MSEMFNGRKLTPIDNDLTFNGKKLTPLDTTTEKYNIGNNLPKEEDYPFKTAVDTIKWAGDKAGKIGDNLESPIDYIMGGSKRVQENKLKQNAIDAMKELDTLEETSLWSNIIKDWTEDKDPVEALKAKENIYRLYDQEFKKRGLGTLGKDGNETLYLITKDGEHLPLDSFMDNLTGDTKANTGVIAGAMGGFAKAPTFANPYLTFGSKALGSAAGAFGGSLFDTGMNSLGTIKDFDAKFALRKAGEEAIADAVLGTGVELGVQGAKYLSKGAKSLKDYIANANLTGAKKLPEEMGINPAEELAKRQKYESESKGGILDILSPTQAQDELAASALQHPRLYNEVKDTVWNSIKAGKEHSKTVTDRTDKILESLEKDAISIEEAQYGVREEFAKTKNNYKAVRDSLGVFTKEAVDGSELGIKEELEKMYKEFNSPDAKDDVRNLFNKVTEKEKLSIDDLFDIRQNLNDFFSKPRIKDYMSKEVIHTLKANVDNQISKLVDELDIPNIKNTDTQRAIDTVIRDYRRMFDVQDSKAYQHLFKEGAEEDEITKKLLKDAKSIDGQLNQVTSYMSPDKARGLELKVIVGAIKNTLVETGNGAYKAIDYKKLDKLLKNVNINNIVSPTARNILESMQELNRLFGLDATTIKDAEKAHAKKISEGFGGVVGRFMTMRTNVIVTFLRKYAPKILGGREEAFRHHVLQSLKRSRTAKEFVTDLENNIYIPKSFIDGFMPTLKQAAKEMEEIQQLEQEAKKQAEEAERIAREERIAKQQAEKEAQRQANIEAARNFTTPSKDELDAVKKLTQDDRHRSFAQKIVRILDGSASEADKLAYIEARNKIGKDRLDKQISEAKEYRDMLDDINANKSKYDNIAEQIAGDSKKAKGLTKSEMDELSDSEDALNEAYRDKFKGNEYEFENPYDVSTKDLKAWKDGTADRATQYRVYNEIKRALEDGYTEKKNIIQEIVQPKPNEMKADVPTEQPNSIEIKTDTTQPKPIEIETARPVEIEGKATAEESNQAMKELQSEAPKSTPKKKQNTKKKQKTYSEEEDTFVTDELTDFKKELLEETGIDVDTLKTPQSWNKTGKINSRFSGAAEMGMADYAMRKVNNEILSQHYPSGFVPDKNIVKLATEAKDSYDIFRGRSVAGTMDGKPKAYIDGLVFDVIEPENTFAKPFQFVKTTGDKYAVAQGISNIIQDTFPKLADEADIVIEPYGASLSFVSNLQFAKDMLKKGKPYYVSVSSYFEPEKSLVYNAIKNGNGKKVQSAMHDLYNGREGGEYYKEMKKLFSGKNGLNEGQLKKAIQDFWKFEEILQSPSLHLMDELDNAMFKMAREQGEQGKKVVFIDDSNYAALPYERSGDVYANPVEGFKKMVADGKMSQDEMDKIIKFANDNDIPLDDQFGKNPQYLLWQKQETYDALTQKNGIVIATNNASPELVRGLSKYDGNIKVFWHQANHVPDQELGIAMRNKRPEYLAIFGGKNGSFSNGRGSDSFYQGKRFDDFGTTEGSNGIPRETKSRTINEGRSGEQRVGQYVYSNSDNAGKPEESTRGLEKSRTIEQVVSKTVIDNKNPKSIFNEAIKESNALNIAQDGEKLLSIFNATKEKIKKLPVTDETRDMIKTLDSYIEHTKKKMNSVPSKKENRTIDYINSLLSKASKQDREFEFPLIDGKSPTKVDKHGNLRDAYTGKILFSGLGALGLGATQDKDKLSTKEMLQKLGL